MTPEHEARFWAKVEKTDTCWLWTAAANQYGYGVYAPRHLGMSTLAHRISYTLLVGPIPDGLDLDHRCHVTLCVRPDHLQPVTRSQNNENRLGAQRNSKSGVRGVYWNAAEGAWRARATVRGRHYEGGRYGTVEEASAAVIALRNRVMSNNLLDRQEAQWSTQETAPSN